MVCFEDAAVDVCMTTSPDRECFSSLQGGFAHLHLPRGEIADTTEKSFIPQQLFVKE